MIPSSWPADPAKEGYRCDHMAGYGRICEKCAAHLRSQGFMEGYNAGYEDAKFGTVCQPDIRMAVNTGEENGGMGKSKL